MKLAFAQPVARKLLGRLDPTGTGAVVGSVRRGKDQPKDIELVLPWFAPDDDPVYRRVEQLLKPDGLFTGQPDPARCFTEVRGLKPGFRSCSIRCDTSLGKWPRYAEDFQVDLFRFDNHPTGNKGWITLMRTGPAEFGEACLAHFKRMGGGGSRDGYLIDGEGKPIPTPLELDAFMVMSIAFVQPEDRVDHRSITTRTSWHPTLTEEAIPFA